MEKNFKKFVQFLVQNGYSLPTLGFANAILANKKTVVTIEEGYQTLQVAHQIIEKIKERATIASSFL